MCARSTDLERGLLAAAAAAVRALAGGQRQQQARQERLQLEQHVRAQVQVQRQRHLTRAKVMTSSDGMLCHTSQDTACKWAAQPLRALQDSGADHSNGMADVVRNVKINGHGRRQCLSMHVPLIQIGDKGSLWGCVALLTWQASVSVARFGRTAACASAPHSSCTSTSV